MRDDALLAPFYDRLWRRYLERTIGVTLDGLPVPEGARVLDVGCGTGLLLAALAARVPSAELHGIDRSPEMLDRARARLGSAASLAVRDASDPPEGGPFDVIVSTSMLHRLPDPREASVAGWVRALAPNGVLAITDWRADHVGTRAQVAALRLLGRRHYRPLTATALVDLMRASGVRVTSASTLTAQGWGITAVRGVRLR